MNLAILQFDVMESFQFIPNPKQDSAFAALKEDGSIIAWGDATGGARAMVGRLSRFLGM